MDSGGGLLALDHRPQVGWELAASELGSVAEPLVWLVGVGRQAAAWRRADGERRQANDERDPTAQDVAQLPAEQQQAAERQRVAVMTHCRPVSEKCSEARADGSAMLTIEMSRTTMSCATATTPRISHRLGSRTLLISAELLMPARATHGSAR